jgi:ATP/maltotriose-dependent transcriptional regulator MalT
LSNLGSLYIQRKEYLRAKDLYDESYAIAKNINDSECLSQSLNGLGIVTNRLGDPDKAINYLQLSADINKSIGLNNEYAQQISNIADIHGEQKKYKDAESEYLTVLKIFSEQNDSFTMSAVNNNLGDLYFKQKMLKKAAVCFEKAYRYSLGFTDVNYNRLIIKNLSSIYHQLGDTKNALKYMKIYDELNNKMVNVAENVKIVELNHAYDTSKKEKQIIQKTAEIQELQSDRKYIYMFIGILISAILLTLYLYKNRVSRNQKLEENIQSIDKQISSLKLENQDLKMKLQQTESELQNLESKYSKDKEKLPDTHVSLSKREYEVLLFIAEGLGDKEIAEKIFVSVTTVRTHIRRIYDKLLVKNRTEAISMLHKYQLTNESA